MKWLDKLERRFGRWYIPNLMQVLLCAQAAVVVITLLFAGALPAWLTLTRSGLLHGQLWRVVTFLFVHNDLLALMLQGASGGLSPTTILSILLGLYLLWFVGVALQRAWGGFRFNLYLLCGVLGAVAAALLTGYCSSYYVYFSLFLAYTALYPQHELLLFFVLPVKVKWIGWLAAAALVLSFLTTGWAGKVQLLLSLAGFFVFFGPSLWSSLRAWVRRQQWKRRNRNNWR